MSYDFLRGYTIPHDASLPPPPPPPPLIENWDVAFPTPVLSYAKYQHPNRYVPPGNPIGKYRPHISRPLKRKYNSNDTTAAKPEVIAEISADGKLAIFYGRDESYPDDLNRLIKPLACELCCTQMNSQPSAKAHYESKQHDRKINTWLNKNFKEKGLNPPQVKRFVKTGPVGPDAFHCEICDLKLTSLTHANQHYAGRKHRLVANNISKPSGTGYYNSDGKWVRIDSKLMPTVANDGRFGIGDQFKHETTAAADGTSSFPDTTTTANGESKSEAPIEVTKSPEPPTTASTAMQLDETLHCKMCNISVTSAVQMKMHLEGVKHRKKLKQCGIEVPPEGPAADSILACITEAPPKTTTTLDLSMYRTPTGSFYCKTCNMSMSHIVGLEQHLIGKKHLRKAAEEKLNAANAKATQKVA